MGQWEAFYHKEYHFPQYQRYHHLDHLYHSMIDLKSITNEEFINHYYSGIHIILAS